MNEVQIRGTVYRSYTEAAKAHGVSPSAVQKAKVRGTLDNVGLGRRISNAERLLDWMDECHLPLQIFREEDGGWVVVDGSTDGVLASGETPLEALQRAWNRRRPEDLKETD